MNNECPDCNLVQQYKIPILVTLDSGEEEVRAFTVEAWSMSDAIDLATQRALEDEQVVEVKGQVR